MKISPTTGNEVQGTENLTEELNLTAEEQKLKEEIEKKQEEQKKLEEEKEDENRKIQISLKTIHRLITDEDFRKMFYKIAREERELKAPMVLALVERELKQQKLKL